VARPHLPRQRRPGRTSAERALLLAGAGLTGALFLFVLHVFVPIDALRLAAFSLLPLSLIALWLAILAWRIPVFANRLLVLIAAFWAVATGLSVWIVLWTGQHPQPPAWRLSAQALALTMSLASGGLFLRALLRRRTSPLVGRLLSLLSPLALLIWILVTSFTR